MFSMSSPSPHAVSAPAVKLRAEWTEAGVEGSTNVALADGPGASRSRAASGHQPTGGHQSNVVHWPGAVVNCTLIILRQTLVQVQERMHVQTSHASATVASNGQYG